MPLLYLLIFLIPFPEYKRFSGFIGDMTMIKFVGIVTVIYALFRHVGGIGHAFWPEGTQKKWFVSFFLLLFVIHFSPRALADWSVHIALFYVIMVLVDSVETIIKMFWLTIAALIVNSFQSIKGVYLYHWYSRATGSFGDANYFAMSLIVCIAMTFCLYRLYPRHRKVLACSATILFFNLLLTGSRGGILGLAIMFLMFLALTKKKFSYLLVVVSIALPIAVFFTPETVTRLLNQDKSTQESTGNRLRLIFTSLEMIKDNPFAGVGYGNYKLRVPEYSPEGTNRIFLAHNSYLSVAAEMGLPLLVTFAGLLLSSYAAINRIIAGAADDERLKLVAISLKIAFVGYCISIAFVTAEREKYLWLMIFLIMALTKICHNKREFSDNKGFRTTKLNQSRGDLPERLFNKYNHYEAKYQRLCTDFTGRKVSNRI